MTIKDCIDIVDNIKPNQYTVKDKVMWLSFIEEIIINEVLKTHEGYDGRYDLFEGYSEDKLSVALIVPSPYDRLYTAYLKMKIDEENGETARYNNSMVLYNTYMQEYRKHYNKMHMPLDYINGRRNNAPSPKTNVGLSDAEYENLKKDLTFILTEFFSNKVSEDKLYDIVTKYIQNNLEMFKGKDDYTPKKGYINLKGGIENWQPENVEDAYGNVIGVRYGQRVYVNNADITPKSQVDLQISTAHIVAFSDQDITFSAENHSGIIYIYCVGSIPQNDYTIQVTVTEVAING